MLDFFVKRGFVFELNNDGSGGGTPADATTPSPSPSPSQVPADGQNAPSTNAGNTPDVAQTPSQVEFDATKLARENERLKKALAGRQSAEAELRARLDQKEIAQSSKPKETVNTDPLMGGVDIDEDDDTVMYHGVEVSKEFYLAQKRMEEQQSQIMARFADQEKAKDLAAIEKSEAELLDATLDAISKVRAQVLPVEDATLAEALDDMIQVKVLTNINQLRQSGQDVSIDQMYAMTQQECALLRAIQAQATTAQKTVNETFESRYPGVNQGGIAGSLSPLRPDQMRSKQREQLATRAAELANAMSAAQK